MVFLTQAWCEQNGLWISERCWTMPSFFFPQLQILIYSDSPKKETGRKKRKKTLDSIFCFIALTCKCIQHWTDVIVLVSYSSQTSGGGPRSVIHCESDGLNGGRPLNGWSLALVHLVWILDEWSTNDIGYLVEKKNPHKTIESLLLVTFRALNMFIVHSRKLVGISDVNGLGSDQATHAPKGYYSEVGNSSFKAFRTICHHYKWRW